MAITLPDPVSVPARQATTCYARRLVIDYDSQSIDVDLSLGNGHGSEFVEIPELAQRKHMNPEHFAAALAVLTECVDGDGVSAWDRLLAIIMQE